MSTTGVPSIASIGPMRRRDPSTERTITAWSPNAVRPVGRPRRKDACELPPPVAARTHPQDVATPAMEPRHDDQSIARRDARETARRPRLDVKPRVGRALLPCRGAPVRSCSSERITPIGRNIIFPRLIATSRYTLHDAACLRDRSERPCQSVAAARSPSPAEPCASASAFPTPTLRGRRLSGTTAGFARPTSGPRRCSRRCRRPSGAGRHGFDRACGQGVRLARAPPSDRRRGAGSHGPGQVPALPRGDRQGELAHPAPPSTRMGGSLRAGSSTSAASVPTSRAKTSSPRCCTQPRAERGRSARADSYLSRELSRRLSFTRHECKAGWCTPMLHVAVVEHSIRFYRLLGFQLIDVEARADALSAGRGCPPRTAAPSCSCAPRKSSR